MINKTSMSYWLPAIKDLGIPIPETIMIKAEYGEGMEYLSENTHIAVERAAQQMGFPCFIKTDMCAGKHSYKDTCYVESLEKLHSNLEQLRDDNFCSDQIFEFIAVRKFIPLAYRFKAFNDLPIAPERRYFIDNGKVECHHPYWPWDAIEFFNVNRPIDYAELPFDIRRNIRNRKIQKLKNTYLPVLDELNQEAPFEIKLLTAYAEKVSKVLPGYWSVDFALGSDGTWYLIDMAEGDRSWHQDDCIVKQERNKL